MSSSPHPEQRHWRDDLRLRWRWIQRFPLTMMLTCGLLLLGSLQAAFQIGINIYRSVTWTQETEVARAEVRELQADLRVFKAAEQAANDPAYLELLARCQGFVRQGETVVVATRAASPGPICDRPRLP